MQGPERVEDFLLQGSTGGATEKKCNAGMVSVPVTEGAREGARGAWCDEVFGVESRDDLSWGKGSEGVFICVAANFSHEEEIGDAAEDRELGTM